MRALSFVAIVCFGALCASSASAQTYSWTGNANDNQFTSVGNWDGTNGVPDAVPADGTTIRFSANNEQVVAMDYTVVRSLDEVGVFDGSSGLSARAINATFFGKPGSQLTTNSIYVSSQSGGNATLFLRNMDVDVTGALTLESQRPDQSAAIVLVNTNMRANIEEDSIVLRGDTAIELKSGSVLSQNGLPIKISNGRLLTLAENSVLFSLLQVSDTGRVRLLSSGTLRGVAEIDGPVQIDSGVLAFGRSGGTPQSGYINGAVTGPGGIEVRDGYTLSLNGSKSFGGDLFLYGGTLRVNSGPSLGDIGKTIRFRDGGVYKPAGSFDTFLAMHFDSEGRIDTTDTTDEHVISLPWTGSGRFVKTGAGIVRMVNDASGFTGDITVEEGDLISGANADTFSDTTSVTVEAAGTLRFFDSEDFAGIDGDGRIAIATGKQMRVGFDNSDYDFAGRVDGPGDVVKRGAGTQRFSGDNSGHTGRWFLNAGAFAFGSGESLSGDLAVNAGRTIFFDPESGESDYAHSLSGDGTVFMTGSGTINLTGDSSGFTGTLFLTHPTSEGGTLNVDGTIAPSTLVVEGDTTLGGSGNILGTVTATSGTIRPAADAARLRVDGADFRSGSTFGVDIASASVFSTLRVPGDMAVNDATLDVDLIDGFLPAHADSFLVLRVNGTVSGSGFSTFDLPAVPGMEWDTSRLLTEGLISIEVALPGDYNLDGTVDAADYTVWRDNVDEPGGTLPSDTAGGEIGDPQYQTWLANFGRRLPTTSAAVPEPGALVLLAGLLAATHAAEQRRAEC